MQVLNTFWHGAELSALHWACVKSFVDRGHQLRLFAYRPLRVPRGTVVEDARQIMGESDLFQFDGSFAAFSDIFRLKLLMARGGWWVDTDVYCLSEHIPDCAYAWAPEDDASINNAILKFPAGDPAFKSILDEAQRVGRNVKAWGEVGPQLLTRRLAGRKFADHYGSTQAFYPVHWLEAFRFWLPGGNEELQHRCAQSPFVHLWAAMFRHFGIDLARSAPDGSFLQWMEQRSEYPGVQLPLDESIRAGTVDSINGYLAQPWARQMLNHLFIAGFAARPAQADRPCSSH